MQLQTPKEQIMAIIEPDITVSLNENERMLRDLLREIVDKEIMPIRRKLDEEDKYPEKVIAKLHEAGIFGVPYDEEIGGMGMGTFGMCIIGEELGRGCLGTCTSFLASMLGLLPILINGTLEQKKKYITPCINGKKVAAFALTEPDAGSDATALKTRAVKKGSAYILNGTKQWISNAGVADIYTVFALTNPSKGTRGVTCFIMEKGAKGLSFGKKEDKMGIRASETRQVIMEDVEVPEENIVGKEGNGIISALKTLNFSRPGVAASAVGVAQGAFEEALFYSHQRKQFGKAIHYFQAIQHMLANMSMEIEAARMLTFKAARLADANHPNLPKYSAMAKAYAADMAMRVTTDAVQIFGGYGYTKDFPVEKYMRDAKILQIYEGTSQIQRNEIATYLIKEASTMKR
jgi:alkylation response protein AidB-like acyl-CoA dehydrogenase